MSIIKNKGWVILWFFFPAFLQAQNRILPIVPQPQNLEWGTGSFTINSGTQIYFDLADTAAEEESKTLIDRVFQESGIILTLAKKGALPNNNYILLKTHSLGMENKEAYSLLIQSEKIEISSDMAPGLFYGIISLSQLFPYGGLKGRELRPAKLITVPSLKIHDYPKYGWRGMHLDVSRHFFGIDFIKRYLDYLSWCKMNVFHWHLTDSQGWRLEIKQYPKLTSIGAFRVLRNGELFSEAEPGKPDEVPNYGGFYTQDQVRDILRYADALHITVLPEIDMPGHSQAAIVAYPQYSSLPGTQMMPSGAKGAYDNSFNPGNDSTYTFLENILTEVMNLFPSPYIHIGGDEVDRTVWKTNALCNELVKRENLKSEDELQSYFTKRIEKFIDSKGRKMIGWDEILEGGIAPRATVMSWRGMKGGITAVKDNHEVIMTPDNFAYFDLYQGDPKQEPEAYSKLTITTAYQFFPAPAELTNEERKKILGGEGALWAETIPTPPRAEYMLFPRLFALSESVWTEPQNKNWDSFKQRLPLYLSLLESAKINYATSGYNVNDLPQKDTALGTVKLICSNELGRGKIYYSLDGTNPGPGSSLYTEPLILKGKKTVKMASFDQGKIISGVNSENFETSLSTSKELIMSPRPSKRFPGLSGFVLTDGVRATDNPQDGRWVGFTGPSMSLVLDLGSPLNIKNFGMDFYTHPGIGIYLPDSLMVETSLDGKVYSPLVQYPRKEIQDMQMEHRVKIYREFNPINARFIRVRAFIPPPGPEDNGHAYVLTDEILVN
jgi:hexosaminidase